MWRVSVCVCQVCGVCRCVACVGVWRVSVCGVLAGSAVCVTCVSAWVRVFCVVSFSTLFFCNIFYTQFINTLTY